MKKLRQTLFLEILNFLKFSLLIPIFLFAFIAGAIQLRDPFYLPRHKTSLKNVCEVKLLGIMSSSDKKAAIIFLNNAQEMVFVGDKVANFKVSQICSNFIVIEKGKIKKRLVLEED